MESMPDVDSLKFNSDGLIPAISQQFDTGEILMMAWMNRESLLETMKSDVACYWSRSRKQFWKKGETSGHIQKIKAIRTDCDRDTLLLLVDQVGVACHTGRKNCFYLEAQGDQWVEIAPPLINPETIYGRS
ncbi:MAG: phosphoribosyl-AMP cyclohydrolase [Magnetococcales bacterium]|nr:phosphoribosyl-AMP cyclohydrolase [Magnetococcales bacterium]HIJ83181.1 phosphoribosyl-AMP cyclohydrolase [Magnetococcales bacterium]